MNQMPTFLILFFVFSLHLLHCQKIEGELKKWHRVTISFEGNALSENDAENPFLNYRLNVTFTHADTEYVVPGFFAADGNASETAADSGKIWKVRFAPDRTGEWRFKASFRKGDAIAISDVPNAGEAVSFDGAEGSFLITDSDKTGRDFRGKGRLRYVNHRYLQFVETQEYFIKGGAGSPESLLAFYEFDQTPASHTYAPHTRDWRPGDPTWRNGKGKNIIGALNYLSGKGMNSVYFLTMSVQGDGNDVWPWNHIHERYRFDCSKLEQWEIVFQHMDKLGLMLHMLTQETENELLLDIGNLGVQRKLYYRELIARFAHHLGLTWNLGEENGYASWSPKAQNDRDRKDAAKYLHQTDPYKNHIALHTHSRTRGQDAILRPMLGDSHLTGPSLQIHDPHNVNETTQRWIDLSQKAGHPWIVPLDEIGPADVGAKPDKDDAEHNEMRSQVLWGNLMAGGAGVEWYFGYKFDHNDLKCEDWRSREILWDQTRHALEFFKGHLPFSKMKAANGLTDNPGDLVFAENGNSYAIYLPEVLETQLDLTGFPYSYTLAWYNPRTGGKLQKGTVRTVKGGGKVSLGFPPDRKKDWVALLRIKRPTIKENVTDKGANTVVLDALEDFIINPPYAKSNYYKDKKNGALAIDAANTSLRDTYAEAHTLFAGGKGTYKISLVTLGENDGESPYVIKLNGTVLDTLVNPPTKATYQVTTHNLGIHYLEPNDLIQVASKAVTNKLIPENDETAWSRGRWTKLICTPAHLPMEKQLEDAVAFREVNGFVEVEAEAFHYRSANGSPRNWYLRPKEGDMPFEESELTDHSEGAGSNLYIEALPDTRITHGDPLKEGENFFPKAGAGGLVSYKVDFTSPGKYFVWARAFSSGTEDNGLHVGIDGQWPENGARMQWCEGKGKWTWSSAQRVPENHCGIPQTIFLEVRTAGEHIISFAMREDGFELDKWIMTLDKDFRP
ncbi:MAG: DUF5060 domain-containing protein [Bacteroidota bacterium]